MGVKYRASKRAKALAISPDTKDKVWERDEGRCVWCRLSGKHSGWPGMPEAHYIPRFKGGLGIEENILTLCRPDHELFDHGTPETRAFMKQELGNYLKSKYPEWDETKLIYRRY